jgi:poly(A) polymerase
MSFLNEIPQLEILQQIAKQKKLSLYVIGGFLRDYFLGRPCFDLDFAVSKDAIAFGRLFAKKVKGAFVLLDKEHGCARVVKKMDDKILTFDFADFRAPTLKGDLLHRDFTINTFCLDLTKLDPSMDMAKSILDLRKGKKDLKAKTIRMNSVKVFKEDPLRLLRAFTLRAQLGFKIEPKTLQQIKRDTHLLSEVSFERVRDELFKILASPRATENLKAMDEIELLAQVIPQITVMYNVKQGGYHHLDVWPHSLEVVAQFEKVIEEFKDDADISNYLNESLGGDRKRFALIKLAAILHDIGKPQTRKKEDGRVSFHSHEHVGKDITRPIAKALKISTHERYALENMVLWHLRPGYLSNFKQPSERSIFRYFRNTKEEAVSILLLSLADQRATRGPLTTETDQKHHEKICLNLVRRYFEQQKEKPRERLITGHDLIKELKLKPSPIFSKILTEVEEQQAIGKVTSRQEALELARKLI